MKRKVLLIALTIALVAGIVGGGTMAWFTAKAEVNNEFTAGTVMIQADSNMIYSQYFDPQDGVFVYGIEGKTGDIYEIDPVNKLENKIFNNPDTYSGWYPNALAFDKANDRLYFARNRTELWFYDFSGDQLKKAGDFKHSSVTEVGNKDVYGAAFGGGYYWYVPNGTAYLFKVAFNPDGTIKSDAYQIMTDAPNMNFGDVVIDYAGGIIYGSATAFYFTYDTVNDVFTNYGATDAHDLQLAWGSDGKLYGHRSGTADTRAWYEITDPNDGSVENLNFQSENSYYDLASGYKSFWNPGDCAWKKFTVYNTGTKEIKVRVDLSGLWEFNYDWLWENWEALCFTEIEDASGEPRWPERPARPSAEWDAFVEYLADLPVPVTSNPVPCEENGSVNWAIVNGYWEYNGTLEAGQYAELCLKVCLDGPGATNEFQGGKFKLNAFFEAVQASNEAPWPQ